MPKLTTVARCLRVPRNTLGRDLVVGDLHGHRHLLEAELERVAFDTRRDRLFCVGDLVDRGPDSLATARLVEEPWFHAVLGNHELMLLNHLGYYSSRSHSRKAFASGTGAWAALAASRDAQALHRVAARMAALPLALYVDADVPFFVTHSGDCGLDGAGVPPAVGEAVSVHVADVWTASRAAIARIQAQPRWTLHFGALPVHLSHTPLERRPLTYLGHSPMPAVTVHQSMVCIDQGVSDGVTLRRGAPRVPTVLDHRSFAYWLAGVGVAQGAAADAGQLQAA